MGQDLTGALYIYTRFGGLTLVIYSKPMLSQRKIPLVEDYGDSTLSIFANDHIGAATSFNAMFDLLHTMYFHQATFEPMNLASTKP